MNLLYHFTSAQNALNIVASGKFHLSNASGSEVEEQFSKNKLFFLSTTRSRSNIFATRTAGGSEVMFVLDADRLRSRYKVAPVNFWQGKREHSEAEERLLSDTDTIGTEFILSIHCNTGINDPTRIKSTPMYLRRLAILANKKKMPIHFYASKKDLLTMRPEKRISAYNEVTATLEGKQIVAPDTRPDFIKQIEKEQKARDMEDLYPYLVLFHMALRRDFSGVKTYSDASDIQKAFKQLSNINGYRVRKSILSDMSRRLMNGRHSGGVGSRGMKYGNAFVLLAKQNNLAFNQVPDFIANRISETVNVK